MLSLNANLTLRKFLKNIGLTYLSMTTSEPTDQNPIQQTLFALDFLAKTSQSQEKEKVSKQRLGLVCSTNSSTSYAWYDQDSSSWKTWQRSLITGWTPYLQSFTRQGYMNANGQLFQRQLLPTLVTNETDGGQFVTLPTPLASTIDRRAKFKQGGTPLLGALLPTPNTMDHLPQRSPEALKRQMEGPRKGRTKLANLREAVNPETQRLFNSMLPTPRASEWKGVGQVGSKSSLKWSEQGYLSGVLNETCSPQTGEATHLNPSFVEEMMGYPIGWTDLDA